MAIPYAGKKRKQHPDFLDPRPVEHKTTISNSKIKQYIQNKKHNSNNMNQLAKINKTQQN
tara:strand:+ start:275 stop:454 length:180 start_codon:yes stop_codon:yes gene_type:complete